MAESNGTIYNSDSLLYELNTEMVKGYALIIAYIAVVIVLGIIGNTMTLLFYGFQTRKSTHTVLISYLAAIDLVTCVTLSDELVLMCFPITFKNDGGCKFIHFINHSFVLASVLILYVISVDQYRRICRHFAWQFTIKSVRVTIAIVIGVALLLSVPHTFTADIENVNLTDNHGHTIHGFVCHVTNDEEWQITFNAFNTIDMLIFVVVTLSFIVLYGLIVREILVSKRNINRFNIKNGSTTKSTPVLSVDDKKSKTVVNVILKSYKMSTEEEITSIKKGNEKTVSARGSRKRKTLGTSTETFQVEVRITLIMIAITIGYFICFIPYFIETLGVIPGSEMSFQIQLISKSYIMNSAINPYIIGAFNPVFRQFVLHVLCKCCFCKHRVFQKHQSPTISVLSSKGPKH